MSCAVLLHGAPVYLRHGSAPVEAIGVVDGRVAAAGSVEQVRASLPSGAVEHRCDGGVLAPAFVDAHQHAYLVGADPSTDLLHGAASDIPGLVRVVSGLLAAGGGSGWARFHGYEPMRLVELRSPTAAELDTVAPDRPLHLMTRTFHESTVNSAGLDSLGIGRTTPDPPGGRVVRDRRGRPTGVLLEAASFAAERASRVDEQPGAWAERLQAHGRRLLSYGITRIGDAAVPATVAADVVALLEAVGVATHPLLVGERIDEPALVPGGTGKVLVDGGEFCHFCMTSRQVRALMTASARASFGRDGRLARAVGRRSGYPRRGEDRLWHTGITLSDVAATRALLRTAAEKGSALALHAVGNGAVQSVLDARARDAALAADVSVRVEHAMAVDPELAARLGAAAVPTVVQPVFLATMGHELSVVPLPAPLRLMPLRTLVQNGVPLVLSSDYPAADLDPWRGIAAAVSRRTDRGRVVAPEEALDLAGALDAYSRAGAEVLGVADAGTLEVGMRADLIWLDRDPYAAGTTLTEIGVLATWRDGTVVHRRADGPFGTDAARTRDLRPQE